MADKFTRIISKAYILRYKYFMIFLMFSKLLVAIDLYLILATIIDLIVYFGG